ncbi:MAG: hypothetical protein FJ253_09250 [Phycisphaerae bacterium]|nr:hypothetical protein [Phycisphaerae bacterium]
MAVFVAAFVAAIVFAACERSTPAPAPAGSTAVAGGATADELLKRMKDRYANATSYRDEGFCTLVDRTKSGSSRGGLALDFVTVFDRSKGLCWRTDQRFDGDSAVHTAVVGSSDFVSFAWSWTMSGEQVKGATAWAAFKETLGNTGRIAGVVPALLVPTMDLRHVRLDPTELDDAARAADETIDGVACAVIDAHGWMDQDLRLWIDATGALHRLRAIREVPASFGIPAGTNETMISYKPEFDATIEPEALCPEGVPAAP